MLQEMDDEEGYFSVSMENTERDEDPTVCDVCLIGEVYENNEILFCDKCDVAVHQVCYGVKNIPDGSWYCYPCSENIDPKLLACELCPYTGGAYKHTDKSGKWAHPICANWIPEVHESYERDKGVYINLKWLDHKRAKLRCAICHKKGGACVQCSYGRCSVAAHSWCALRNTAAGYTKRIVKDGEDSTSWEIFCKSHATAVSDPVKQKKNKSSNQSRFEEDEEVVAVPKKDKPSHDGVGGFDQLRIESGTGKELLSNVIDDRKDESDDDSDEGEGENQTTFPLLNLSEWPGISEGEGMDSDHFWNYISGCFPEDHSHKWLQFVLTAATRPNGWCPNNDAIFTWTCDRTDPTELHDLIDEILSSFRCEKDAKNACLYAQRDRFLKEIEKTISVLATNDESVCKLSTMVQDSAGDGDPQSTYGISMFDSEHNMLVEECFDDTVSTKQEIVEQKSNDGITTLKVVFDGQEKRYKCEFAVIYPVDSVDNLPVSSDREKWHLVDVIASAECEESLKFAVINPSKCVSGDINNIFDDVKKYVAIKLIKFSEFNDHEECYLHDRTVISKFDDVEMSRIIATDQKAYTMLMESFYSHVERIIRNENIYDRAGKFLVAKPEWKNVNLTYERQQIWKRIGHCLEKGIKDQRPDFNNVVLAAPPASWAIGRDAPDPDEDEPEPHEDAVCMCCFDGGSEDRNKILFCDGCNATVHQLCYGISEVPEGDYFCDRCLYVQRMAHKIGDDEIDYYDIKNSATCVLCPLHHGALKRTKSGNWVHMCCALWSNNAVIDNLVKIPSIDISAVDYTPLVAPLRRGSDSSSSPMCIYCSYQGGYLATCCSDSCGFESCQVMFHPLCAWFGGAYFHSVITDPTFQGLDRQGKYPSGMCFTFLCDTHSERVRNNTANGLQIRSRDEQSGIRRKYRINESDLVHVPGRKKKRVKKASKVGGTNSRKTTTTSTVQHRLSVDSYQDKCAVCLRPASSQSLFGSPYDAQVLGTELPEFTMPDFEAEALSNVAEVNHSKMSEIRSSDNPYECLSEDKKTVSLSSEIVNAMVTDHNASVNWNSSSIPILRCIKCNIVVHRCCIAGLEFNSDTNLDWQCQSCTVSSIAANGEHGDVDRECILCPRRGGYLRRTTDGNSSWAHIFCARNAPGHVTITGTGDVDIRQLSKLSKKQKCSICNRKHGTCIQCHSLGCVTFFHPLCVARSNKGFISTRFGMQVAYCTEHIPPGVEYHQPTSHWFDTNELIRLQTTLERSRLIVDLLVRRDKHKKMLCKAEHEIFTSKFKKMLSRTKGGKKAGSILAILGGNAFDVSVMDDEESEYESSSEDDEVNSSDDEDPANNQYIPFTELFQDYHESDKNLESCEMSMAAEKDPARKNKSKKLSEATTVKHASGQSLRISGAWHRKGEIKLPKSLRISFSGGEIGKKDTYVDGGYRGFMKKQMDQILHREESSRPGTQMFANTKQAVAFGKDLGAQLIRQMEMSDTDFQDAVRNAGFDFPVVMSRKSKRDGNRKSNTFSGTIAQADTVPNPDVQTAKSGRQGKVIELLHIAGSKDDKKAFTTVLSSAELLDDDDMPIKKKKKSVDKEAVECKEHNPEASSGNEWLHSAEQENEQLIIFSRSSAVIKEVMRLVPPPSDVSGSLNRSSSKSKKRSLSLSSSNTISEKHLVEQGLVNLSGGIDCSWSLIEWKQYDDVNLFELERMIQVILTNITQYRIVDQYFTKQVSSPKKSSITNIKKKKSGDDQHLEGRSIEDDFDEAPEDLNPPYQQWVRRIVTLSTIRDTLHFHGYRSLGAFSLDFFTMLNNARLVTASNSQTWKDTKLFTKLFEDYKRQVLDEPTIVPLKSSMEWKLNVERISDLGEDDLGVESTIPSINYLPSGSRSGNNKRKADTVMVDKIDQKLYCGGCRAKFLAKPWPSTFEFPENSVSLKPSLLTANNVPSTPARRSSRLSWSSPVNETSKERQVRIPINNMDDEWQWLCGDCMTGYGQELCGLEVRMWWHDDSCAYDGIFNAYDSASHCHRVLYEDEEWEFANFTQEVFMIRPKSDSTVGKF